MNQYSRIFCKDIQAAITTADLTRTTARSDAEIEFSSFVNLMSLKKSHKYAPLQMDSQNWHLHISSFKVYKLLVMRAIDLVIIEVHINHIWALCT